MRKQGLCAQNIPVHILVGISISIKVIEDLKSTFTQKVIDF